MNQADTTLPRKNVKIKFSLRDEIRLFSRIKKVEGSCWEWTGPSCRDGYGRFWIAGNTIPAHRAMLFLKEDPNGERDFTGLFACHTCDNPGCLNPDHLYFGTPQDNHRDMQNRMRIAHGERSGATNLTESQVTQIRELYMTGEFPSRKLARKFGVAKSTILRIIHHKTWKYFKTDSAPPQAIRKPDYLTFVEELFRWG